MHECFVMYRQRLKPAAAGMRVERREGRVLCIQPWTQGCRLVDLGFVNKLELFQPVDDGGSRS